MELCVQGAGLRCAAFQLLLFVALRTLVDRLGAATFNVGVYNIPAGTNGASIGALEQPAPLLARCFSSVCHLQLVADRLVLHAAVPQARELDVGCRSARMLLRRVVSRGRPSSRVSDFGGLEVFGHASIGNTDPYTVFAALQEQWAAQMQGQMIAPVPAA